MLVLGIETSCDETSFALLETPEIASENFYEYINSQKVLSSVTSSQVEKHIPYGGIVPEVGARLHAQQIHYIFELLLQNASKSDSEFTQVGIVEDTNPTTDFSEYLNIVSAIKKIYVTTNPGLASALRIGLEFAKTIKFFVYKTFGKVIDIVEVNHLQGHVMSCFVQPDKLNLEYSQIFPHLHLIVSGGNSQLLLLSSPTSSEIIGRTLDDAAGECMDKIGRMLGFPYPGGLNLARVAKLDKTNYMNFPVGMTKSLTLDYSFSGLKTAVRLYLENHAPEVFDFEQLLDQFELESLMSSPNSQLSPKLSFIKKVSISAQSVVTKQLINKLKKAILVHRPASIGLSGGVSANLLLRQEVNKLSIQQVFVPPIYLTGDSAIMIALAGSVQNAYILG